MKFLRLVGILSFVSSLAVASFSAGLVTGCATADKYDTSTPEGAFKQAEEYAKDERYEEAVQRFTDLKNKHPYSRFATEAELRIADMHFQREAFIEAQSAYQLFKEFHPKHPRSDYVTYRLALSCFKQLPASIDRDLTIADKAILYFDEVVNSYPTSEFIGDAKQKRTDALKMLAEKELYIANFYAKRENFDSATGRYETVLKKYPNLGYDAQALYGAARSAIRAGEKDRGSQHLKNLYTLFPKSDEANRARSELRNLGRSDIKELLETAREHFREGNYRITEPLLQQLLMSDARNPEVFQMMATIYYDQGKFNKAIKTFRRALEIDPTYTDASVGLSIILNDIGRYEEGRKVFLDAQEALAKKSTDSDPYLQEKIASKHDELGELYFQYKRYDEALEQYNRALSMSTRKAELKMKVIECFTKKNDEARAIKELKALVQEFPQFVPARLKLGLMYFNQKNTVAAVEQWETVLLRDPDHPVAQRYLQMAQETGSTLLA